LKVDKNAVLESSVNSSGNEFEIVALWNVYSNIGFCTFFLFLS